MPNSLAARHTSVFAALLHTQWPYNLICPAAGIDDAQALMIALRAASPDIEVIAITASHGNIALKHVVGNICAVLDAAGKTLPVYVGAETALVSGPDEDGSMWHGKDGLGDLGLGAVASRAHLRDDMNAATAIATLCLGAVDRGEAPIEVLTLGPLTNLATALRLFPRLAEALGTVTVMGGAYTGKGNVTVAAEYNMYGDPEAAAVVFAAPIKAIRLASWELTLDHMIPKAFVEGEYLHGRTPVSAWLKRVCAFLIAASGPDYEKDGFMIPDPLAAAIAVGPPSLVTKSVKKRVLVETGGKYTRGMTLVDWSGMTKQPENVEIVQALDMDLLKAMLVASVKE